MLDADATTRMEPAWRVLGRRGCGSAIVESALVLAKIPYEREQATPEPSTLDPLAQVPMVILPDGTVMTESAALVLYIGGTVPELRLVPDDRDPLRREFLRWLMFLVAAVYPTFTSEDAATADEHRKSLWRLVEGAVRGPWFLGETPSALDLYVAVMTRWRPGRAWFAEHCPRLREIAVAVDADPRLVSVWRDNFSAAG